jgi:hypothetical protein
MKAIPLGITGRYETVPGPGHTAAALGNPRHRRAIVDLEKLLAWAAPQDRRDAPATS